MQHTNTCRHHPSSPDDAGSPKVAPCPPKEVDPCDRVAEARWCEGILCFLHAQLGALGGCLEWVSGSVHWFATSGQPLLLGDCDCDAGSSESAEILLRIGCGGKATILRVRCPMKCGKVDPEGVWTYRLDGAERWCAFCPGARPPRAFAE